MPRRFTIAVVSDIHYASAAEQARGDDFEFRGIPNPLLRLVARAFRHFIWSRHPLRQNHLLDQFLHRVGTADFLVANGDYSCNSAFVGVSDDAACLSAQECLGKLRRHFGDNFRASFGDHELGKLALFSGLGGMRLASWRRARETLRLEPFWQVELGNHILMGLVSSLVALPVYEADTLPDEYDEWESLREQHLIEIRRAFDELPPGRKVVLFCHDPTALPFLRREEAVCRKLSQIEHTIIGHLHSKLIFWKSRLLAGMPRITSLGHAAKRMSTALREARHWQPFNVRFCPSLAGIELLKDGGYATLGLNGDANQPAAFRVHRLPR